MVVQATLTHDESARNCCRVCRTGCCPWTATPSSQICLPGDLSLQGQMSGAVHPICRWIFPRGCQMFHQFIGVNIPVIGNSSKIHRGRPCSPPCVGHVTNYSPIPHIFFIPKPPMTCPDLAWLASQMGLHTASRPQFPSLSEHTVQGDTSLMPSLIIIVLYFICVYIVI